VHDVSVVFFLNDSRGVDCMCRALSFLNIYEVLKFYSAVYAPDVLIQLLMDFEFIRRVLKGGEGELDRLLMVLRVQNGPQKVLFGMYYRALMQSRIELLKNPEFLEEYLWSALNRVLPSDDLLLEKLNASRKFQSKLCARWETKAVRVDHPFLTTFLGGSAVVISSVHVHELKCGNMVVVAGSENGNIRFWEPLTGKLLLSAKEHTSSVTGLCSFRDSATNVLASAAKDCKINIWDVEWHSKSRALLYNIVYTFNAPECGGFTSLCRSNIPIRTSRTPKGFFVWSGSEDGALRYWESQRPKCLVSIQAHSMEVTSLCLVTLKDTTKSYIVSASLDSTVKLWDAYTGRLFQTLQHQDGVRALCTYSQWDMREMIVSGSEDSTIKIWDAASGQLETSLDMGANMRVNAVTAATLENHKTIVMCGLVNSYGIQVWSIGQEAILQGHSDDVNCLCVSPVQKGKSPFMISGSWDTTVKLWDLSKYPWKLKGGDHFESGSVIALIPHQNKPMIVHVLDKTTRLLDAKTGETIVSLPIKATAVTVVRDKDTGKYLVATGSDNNNVEIWEPLSGTVLQTLRGHSDKIYSLCTLTLSDGRNLVVSGSWDRTIKLWDVGFGNLVWTLDDSTVSEAIEVVTAVTTAKGQQLIVSGSDDCAVNCWDALSKQLFASLQGHSDSIAAVSNVVLPNGVQYLISGSKDSTIKLWDLESKEEHKTFTGHHDGITCLCVFSIDNQQLLASGAWDNTVKLWDIVKGVELATYVFRETPVLDLTYIGSNMLAVGCESGKISVLDVCV